MGDPITDFLTSVVTGTGDAISSATNYIVNSEPGKLIDQTFQNITDIRDPIDSRNPNLNQSKYDFDFKSFPQELGSDVSNHYMIININIPVGRQSDTPRGSYYGNVFGQGGFFKSELLEKEYSNVDNINFGGQKGVGAIVGGGADARERQSFALPRNTRRIAQSIALYMPAPMIYTHLNVYEEISLTAIAGQVGKLGALPIGKAIASYVNSFQRQTIDSGLRGGDAIGKFFNSAGNIIGTSFALAGNPINPRIEVLFSQTPQRQFNFEFLLAPRSEYESKALKEIVKTLRFHAAPEIDTKFLVPTFIPPAEFDITFYKNGLVNESIPRINTCVLERIEIDYAPSGGWASFSNGHPVAARLSLAFRELEIVHKRRVLQGF